MLNSPDEKDLADPPFVRVMVTVYIMLSLLMIPLGFAFIAGMIISKLKGFLAAADLYEKIYRTLNAIAHILFAYGAFVLGLLAVDSLLGEPWKLSWWWPTISQSWYEAANRTVIILLDVLTILVASSGLMCAARYFGYLDENDRWRAPDWLLSKYRINEVMLEDGIASEHSLSSSGPASGRAIESKGDIGNESSS